MGDGKKEMLRKKTHVVRKKTHVVRNFFYVASIFYGAPPRQNRYYVISFVPTARRLVAGYNLHAAMQNCGRPPRHRDEPPRRHDGNAPRALPSAGGNAQGGIWKRRGLIPKAEGWCTAWRCGIYCQQAAGGACRVEGAEGQPRSAHTLYIRKGAREECTAAPQPTHFSKQ